MVDPDIQRQLAYHAVQRVHRHRELLFYVFSARPFRKRPTARDSDVLPNRLQRPQVRVRDVLLGPSRRRARHP